MALWGGRGQQGGDRPKISCLMVTRGHLFPGRFAVECFRRQTYGARELVVVCDRPDSPLGAWIGTLADPSIRYIEAEPAPLGALRNVSVAAAQGNLACQWDDDDLYHPRRLDVQQAMLANAGADAHFLTRWLFWWPARRLLAVSNKRVWEGSMLVKRDLLMPYPELALGEDTEVVDALQARHRVATSSKPGLYCYIVHGGNSWDDAHFEEMVRRADRTVRATAYESQLRRLSENFPVEDYARWVAGRAVAA